MSNFYAENKRHGFNWLELCRYEGCPQSHTMADTCAITDTIGQKLEAPLTTRRCRRKFSRPASVRFGRQGGHWRQWGLGLGTVLIVSGQQLVERFPDGMAKIARLFFHSVIFILCSKIVRQDAARERMRIDGGGYRRDHLRTLAQRVEVADTEVRIMGSKNSLLGTLVAAAGGKIATLDVRSSVLNWRMG